MHTLPYSPSSPFLMELQLVLNDETGELVNTDEFAALMNVAFWASLKTEEGQFAPIAISFEPPGEMNNAGETRFEVPLEYSVESLVKLSPVFGGGVTRLCVWRSSEGAQLACWGVGNSPTVWPTVTNRQPGHLVVSVNGLVIADMSPGAPPRVRRRHPAGWDLTLSTFLPWDENQDERLITAQLLRFLASAMQHGRGGTVLLVDDGLSWEPSLHIKYKTVCANDGLRATWQKLVQVDDAPERTRVMHDIARRVLSGAEVGEEQVRELIHLDDQKPPIRTEQEWLMRCIHTIGRLTAVDGAVVLTRELKVVGFGAKILARGDPPSALWVSRPESGEGLGTEVQETELTGGMRHRSAAQFVQDNPTSIALVASQDGRITVFHSAEGGVSAFACEDLLPAPVHQTG